MLSPSACRNSGACFLLNSAENLYNVPQSGGSYFRLITPEPTLSYHPATLRFGKGLAEHPPPGPALLAAGGACLPCRTPREPALSQGRPAEG